MSLERLTARIRTQRFHGVGRFNASGTPFFIGQTEEGTTIKGEMASPRLGEPYAFYGEYRHDPKYDERYFRFYAFELLVDRTVDGITDYLRKHVRRLGPKLAAKLVEEFGVDTLTVLRTTPDQAMRVPGVTAGVVDAIRDHFEDQCAYDPAAYASLHALFGDFRVPDKTRLMLLRHWGSDAPEKIKHNPYMLLSYPRMGWQTVDQIALERCGYDRRGIYRQMAAVVECLEREANEGHTFGLKSELEMAAYRLIDHPISPQAWGHLQTLGVLTYCPAKINGQEVPGHAITKYYLAEQEVAIRLRSLAQAAESPSLPFDLDGLEEEQIPAARTLEANGVAILTGPPGSGKTHSVTKILTSFDRETLAQTLVIAPTGKAAKRAAELIERHFPGAGVTCSTCHRALKLVPSDEPPGVPSEDAKFNRGRDEFAFHYDHNNWLPYRVIIMEETSMTDVQLMAAVLRAVEPGTRLIFVGDEHQLPSVRPGAVLRDMIAGGIPTARLSRPRRNAGLIAHACYEILNGRVPRPAARFDLATGMNWMHIEESDAEKAARIIVGLHERTKRDPFWDLQVVSPEKNRKPLACSNLNTLLSRLLNPRPRAADCPDGGENEDVGPSIAIGDKVVRTKNGVVDLMIPRAVDSGGPGAEPLDEDFDYFTDEDEYETWRWQDADFDLEAAPVVNGDLGRVEDIVQDRGKRYAVVRFTSPDRLCRIPWGEHHLILAYAITVHKCVHPDTIVETAEGLLPIRMVKSEGRIATPSGEQAYRGHVSYPEGDSIQFFTEDGFGITVTPDHKMEAWSSGGYTISAAEHLLVGQWMRLRMGVSIDPSRAAQLPCRPPCDCRAIAYRVPVQLTEDFAEFLGMMVADGTIWDRGFRLAKRYPEVVERFGYHCRTQFGAEPKPIQYDGATGLEINSTLIVDWLRSVGGMDPNAKDVPDCILRSPLTIHKAFLRGLFEDGGCNLRNERTLDHIEWSSVYPRMVQTVKIMLLRCGIVSSTTKNRPESLYIYGANALRFATEIGFIACEKQRRAMLAVNSESRYRIPVLKSEILPLRSQIGSGSWTLARYQHALHRQYVSRSTARVLLAEGTLPHAFLDLLSDRLGYHHVRITRIQKTRCPSMCVEVPNGNRFLQNGFPHGNSQGSGFPYVIVPLHSSFYAGGVTRELVYTAFSRAEDVLVTVGEFSALVEAVKRRTVHKRRTRLVEFLRAPMEVSTCESH